MKRLYPDNIYILQFEKLCTDPVSEIGSMLDFCKIDYDSDTLYALSSKVITPATIGRFRQFGTDCFNRDDIEFVSEMGFPIS